MQIQLASLPQVNAVNFQCDGGGGKKFGNQKKMFYCTYCNNVGHTMDRCYKKHGYPSNHRFKNRNGTNFSSGMNTSVKNLGNMVSSNAPSFAGRIMFKMILQLVI